MTKKLSYVLFLYYAGLQDFPPYVGESGLTVWERSFVIRQQFLRNLIAQMIVESGDGSYRGDVGDHSLSLFGISVHVEDGYAALLHAWIGSAISLIDQARSTEAEADLRKTELRERLRAIIEYVDMELATRDQFDHHAARLLSNPVFAAARAELQAGAA